MFIFSIIGPNFNQPFILLMACTENHLKGANSKILVILNCKWCLSYKNVQIGFLPILILIWPMQIPDQTIILLFCKICAIRYFSVSS